MLFTFVLSPHAQAEYEASALWYFERSPESADNFRNAVDKVIDLICNNPFLGRNTESHYYEIKVKRFPFPVVYVIDENHNVIFINSIFHQKRNPFNKFLK